MNVSTLASLVVAASGVCVAKHGNRAVSSRCGSADLVASLGIKLHGEEGAATNSLRDLGFAFLMAPAFHPAAAAVAAARKTLGTRTVFNLLGPLANPARPTHQVLCASDPATARLMAEALGQLGIERAFVVHGSPGWDEATPCGPFLCLDVQAGTVRESEIDPRIYGVPRCSPADLCGGDIAVNSAKAEAFLGGKTGPIRDAVLLNAALALQVTGVQAEPRQAFEMAAAAVDDGSLATLVAALRSEGADQ